MDAEIAALSYKPIPAGAFTIEDFMQHQGCKESKAQRLIKELRKAGKLEDIGRINRLFYYRLK